MLKPVTNITITQRGKDRNKTLFFDFVNHYEVSDNWESLTTNGKVIFPKNIYVDDVATKKKFPLFGENKKVSSLFQRGDKIKIESYYIYWDKNLNELQTPKNTIIDGYISKVNAKLPIELEIEDSMWLLKQIPMKNQVFAKNTSVESILTDALQGTGLTVNIQTKTFFGFENMLLTAENETVAQFLAKLKKDCNCFPYFRGTELRIGSFIYLESEAKTKTFQFQENIIDSDLKFSKKEDVNLSCVAYNHIEEKTGSLTKDGQSKTKKSRIEVLIWYDKTGKIQHKTVKNGDKPDANLDGERHKFAFPYAKNESELLQLGTEQLKKYYYDGFKGTFTTFGTPHVVFGDNAKIVNDLLPEQNGTYKIKAVDYEGGVGGMRQKITLDFKFLI